MVSNLKVDEKDSRSDLVINLERKSRAFSLDGEHMILS